MTAEAIPRHQLKMNSLMSNSTRNNRRLELHPMQNKMHSFSSGDNSCEASPTATADSVLELLELLSETALTPIKNSRRRVKKDAKDFEHSLGNDETRGRVQKKPSPKTEHSRTRTPSRDRMRPLQRTKSSMQIKESPVQMHDKRVTKSLRGERRNGMMRIQSLEDKLRFDALPFLVEKEEASNCSMTDNSFFQDTNSCLGDFHNFSRSEQQRKKMERKMKMAHIFEEDLGFSPFNADPFQEQPEEPSEGSYTSEDGEKRRRRSSKPNEQHEEPSEGSYASDDGEKRRRPSKNLEHFKDRSERSLGSDDGGQRRRRSSKGKRPHRKPPQRQSSGDGLAHRKPPQRQSSGDGLAHRKPPRRQSSGDGLAHRKPPERQSSGDGLSHRKPPERQSSGEGLVLHSSSANSAHMRDVDQSRRRRKSHCNSAGKIRNNRTLEEYTGFFLTSPGEDNLKNGFGISRFPDGRVFEGLYDQGKMVEGKMTYPAQGQTSATTYIGKFDEDGLRCGKGIYITATGTFLGEFYKDDQEGTGIFIYHDENDGADINPATAGHHRRFLGHWKEGRRHGYGKEILADGTIQEEGSWHYGRLMA